MNKLFLLSLLFPLKLLGQSTYHSDFEKFWNDLNDYYAYFEEQGINWNKVKDIYEPKLDSIDNKTDFIVFLEEVINELHNGHISLNTNLPTSNRIIPSGADIFAEKRGDSYFIKDLRKDNPAELSGLKVGMRLVMLNNIPVKEGILQFLPKFTPDHSDAMYEYAINMLFAGQRNQKREIAVENDGTICYFYPDSIEFDSQENLLEYKRLKDGVGYIKINNSLGNTDLIYQFDVAIDSLYNSKALILDLTETPSGGNTLVARAIMGRFISKGAPYQMHMLKDKEFEANRKWIEIVNPRKTAYSGKLFVIVGHWTGSMGEGIAIGFDAMKRGEIIGTKMAGLLGAIYTFEMPNTEVGYQFPIENMYHINGTPREDFVPKHFTKSIEESVQYAIKLASPGK